MKQFHSLLLIMLMICIGTNTYANDIVINEVNFPDEIFRAYLKEQTYGEDGIITEDEIKQIQELLIEGKGIKNLEGIGYFTALKSLDCRANQLANLVLYNNTNLEVLKCNQNSLTNLDLSKNTKLYDLSCGSNKLIELDMSNNIKLYRLNCAGNQLTSLDLKNNRYLWILYCDRNNLSNLELPNSKSQTLAYLECNDNRLTNLDLSHCDLIKLRCDNNQLKALDVSKNTDLKELYCDGNQLSTLDVSNNIYLQHLYCSENQLASLNVAKNNRLYSIKCINNQINGKSMDDLMASLPKQESANIYIIDLVNDTEKNVCTANQVSVAKEKGWSVWALYDYDYFDLGLYKEYEGSASTSISSVSLNEENYKIYSVEGKPLNRPQKGVNIIRYQNGTTKKIIEK